MGCVYTPHASATGWAEQISIILFADEEAMMRRLLLTVLVIIIFSLITGFGMRSDASASRSLPQPEHAFPDVGLLQGTPVPIIGPQMPDGSGESAANQVHALYFYAFDCTHCQVVMEEVIKPLESAYDNQLDMHLLEIGVPQNYELFIQSEELYQVGSSDRAIPMIIVGEQALVGEEPIRNDFEGIIKKAVADGGLDFPDIPGLDPLNLVESNPEQYWEEGICSIEEETCDTDSPIYAAYFYQVGCKECSIVEADINYLHSQYPQLIVEEFNVYDSADLGDWMAQRAGRNDWHTPALFIGDKALVGAEELDPASIQSLVENYAESGSEKVWESYDPNASGSALLERFQSMGWMTVVLAGLVDGLNPCAFATLIFFVSYLTISGRRGRAVLAVGGAFTIGVFLAYLGVGLGLYKVLDIMGQWLTIISRWVYAITALLCLGLAIYSFMDFLKARRGNLKDMSLNLPKPLRKRINAVIRRGRDARSYVFGAFVAGLLISFLELACTGQIYLPTIIFVSSIPELRLKAMYYLVLYNLLFVAPLVVVFIMAYYGTTSDDLINFMQKNAAAVKLGMMVLFLSLGGWLALSLLA